MIISSSLLIQLPLVRSRCYVRAAGANQKRLYSQAQPEAVVKLITSISWITRIHTHTSTTTTDTNLLVFPNKHVDGFT